jgi:DNA (cytosine-5)-methyltransferase 1
MANDNGSRLQQRFWYDSGDGYGDTTSAASVDGGKLPGPTNGFWGTADWLFCRDNKWRSVESGTFPLVDGTPARVGRLRGYGNAIVAPVAQAFIESYLEAIK